MDEPTTRLVNEFSSLIDEALVLTISLDYDLSNSQDFQLARQTLLALSENVPSEEASGFNSSGLGAQHDVDIRDADAVAVHDELEQTRNIAVEGDLRSNDGLTTTTESSIPQSILSTDSSKASTSEDAQDSFQLGLADLSDDDKEVQLQHIFPELKRIDITLALQKFKGDTDRAVEQLLTTAHLDQTGQRKKGIDGFYVDDDHAQIRKKKGKKKRGQVRLNESTNPSSANSSDESVVPEETHTRHIVYLAQRLPFGESEVQEIYNQKHKSMGAALVQIMDNYLEVGVDISVANEWPEVREQTKKYPWVPAQYMAPAFTLSSGQQHAVDLIQILAEYYEKPAYLRYDISYNIAAPRIDVDTIGKNSSNSFSAVARAKGTASPGWNSPTSSVTPTGLRSSDLAEMRNHSFQASGAAYRKGGLYRSAAAVHSERGRDLTDHLHQARGSEAAHYVDQRSRPDQIDLHGVTVKDGVSIALDRVWIWWQSLGEERARRARDGFTIVTGLGRHSAGGVSQLRISVFKALVADGWRVTVLTGQYLVTGRK